MSTYRKSPARPKPVVIVLKRSILLIVVALFCLAIPSLFVVLLCGRSTVECSRNAGTCRVVVDHGLGLVPLDKTVPLSSVARATVESHVDDEGDTVEGVAVVIDGKPITLDGSSNVGHTGKVEWAAAVNKFLNDPYREHFEIQRGVVWPVYVWACIAVIALISVARARTTLVVDKANGTALIVRRVLRTTNEEIALHDIASADVHEKMSDDTPVRAIVLMMKDGTRKELGDYSNVGDAGKHRTVAEINKALAEET